MGVSTFLLALIGLAFLAAGAGIGLAVGLIRAQNAPREGLAAALMRLEAERSKDRMEMAAMLEQAADVGETIKRHRHRIDGAEGARSKREQREQEQVPAAPPMSPLEQVRARARAAGKL